MRRLAAVMTDNIRRTLIVVSTALATACADSPTAPETPIDRVAAARLTPSVTDARIRLVNGIDNPSVRERVTHDLQELEIALANGDGRKARFHVRVIGSVVDEYRVLDAGRQDAPDLSAIGLVLYQVSQLVSAGYEVNDIS
jgi:hypothetical protein